MTTPSRPIVSVVMPSYNHSKFINDAIGSVVSQTLENWELIIVDDHSKDESAVVIKDWMRRDSRIKAAFHSKNEGIARTLTQGIQMATGKYVSMMASDDMFARGALQQMTEVLEKNPNYGVAVAEGTVINESGEPIGKTTSEVSAGGRPRLDAGSFFDELISHNFVFCNEFRREITEKHGIRHDEKLKFASDWLFWLDLSAVCDFVYIAEPLYYYRVHPRNTTELHNRVLLPPNSPPPPLMKKAWGEDFMVLPEKVFSRYAKILNVKQRRRVLEFAAYWCQHSSFEPAKSRGAMYHAIAMDLNELDSKALKLENELARVQDERELQGIMSSFRYRIMRFYGSRIDRAFPDNTRRGELKNIVKQSLRIASSQGIVVLFRLALQKLRRRQFTIAKGMNFRGIIVEPLPEATQPVGTQRGRLRLSFAKGSPPQIKIRLESLPRLSSREPTKVSERIIVAGWAISTQRIKEIRIYLDDKFVGLANYGLHREDIGNMYSKFPDSHLSGFHKSITLDYLSKGAHRLRVVAQTHSFPTASIEGLIEIDEGTYHRPISSTIEMQRKPAWDTTVSVIILTKQPPADFEQTLVRLRSQVGIPDPEIVIVNSGRGDLSSLTTKYRLKVYDILPEEFDHATTRNFAAEKATGEYLVFSTDDAIPAREDLLSNMIQVLSDSEIGAVSARQIPRSDADMMYCQAMWGHYRMLGLNRDRIVGTTEFDRLSYEQKRAICQIDDVCSCFHRDTLLKYKYATSYGEDFELGTRLLKDGYRIAQLFSTGVVHSHNRPPSYYLKRSYVDLRALRRLFNHGLHDLREWPPKSLNDLLDLILRFHRSLSQAIDDLAASQFCDYDIQKALGMIWDGIRHLPEGAAEAKSQNHDLSTMLGKITERIDYREGEEKLPVRILAGHYYASIHNFQEWLINSHQDLRDLETDFVETLYKLFAAVVGQVLAQYVADAQKAGRETDKTAVLDRFLSEGI